MSIACATAEAVCRRFPTAVARLRSQVRPGEIRGRRSGIGADFLRVLRFPLPVLIPPNAPYSSIIWCWYNWPISGGRTRRTQSRVTPQKKNTDVHPTLAGQSTLNPEVNDF
jgi:hypothetical protein